MSGLITGRAKKPSTTLGMPASISRIGFSIRRSRGLGVLGQVDRGAQAERRGDDHRDDRDHQRARRRSSGCRTRRRRGNQPSVHSDARSTFVEEVDRAADERDDDRDADRRSRCRPRRRGTPR